MSYRGIPPIYINGELEEGEQRLVERDENEDTAIENLEEIIEEIWNYHDMKHVL